MSIVDRGRRGERHPRSQWPANRHWRGRSRIPETPPPVRLAPPTATYLIMALCIAVFAYGEATGTGRVLVEDYGYLPSRLGEGGRAGYVGLLTHMFLHGGWVHLIVNMIVLWSFGRGLEPAMGSIRFVLLYLSAGVLAALAHGIVNGQANVILIGASGAIAGVVGAAAIAAPRMPVIFVIFPMPLWIAVIALVALHIAAIAFDWEPEIAWHAHLAGLAVGALLYPLLRRRSAA
ncbi:MAG TPA: rhomboid family intramembrane serine protease [Alphaproteobacteria bacterium]